MLHDGDLIAWQADLPGGKIALALFNAGDAPMNVDRKFAAFSTELGKHPWNVQDVWTGKSLGRQSGVSTTLAPHASLLLLLH